MLLFVLIFNFFNIILCNNDNNSNSLYRNHIIDTDDYTIYRLGSLIDISTNSFTGVGLIGGGSDTNKAFIWQINNANMGDFLVLRATGNDAYNEYIMNLSILTGKKLNSVTTIVCKSKDSSYDKIILDYINNAEAIFFAGGDQSLYINYWKDTPIQLAIQRRVPYVTIAGTSAGLAILGNWIYSAENGSVYSDESLLNPYNKYITLSSAFIHLPYLETVLTDTHFLTRDRMGRMITFAGRVMTDNSNTKIIHAIGIDEQTALLVNTTTGDVITVGVSSAFVCKIRKSPSICTTDEPLTFTDIPCVKLSGKSEDKFSFQTWLGEGEDFTLSIQNGKFITSKYGI